MFRKNKSSKTKPDAITELRNQIEAFQDQQQLKDYQACVLQQQNDDLTAQLREAREELEHLKLKQVSQEVALLERDHTLSELKHETESLNNRMDEVTQNLSEAIEKGKSLEEENAEIQEKLDKAQGVVMEMQGLKEECEQNKMTIEEQEKTIQDLNNTLKAERKELRTVKLESEFQLMTAKMLDSNKVNKRSKNDSSADEKMFHEQLENIKDTYKAKVRSLQLKLDNFEANMEEKKSFDSQYAMELRTTQKLLQQKELQFKKLQVEKESFESELDNLRIKQASSNKMKSALSAKNRSLSEKILNLESQLKQGEDKLKTAKDNYFQSEANKTSLNLEITNLNEKLSAKNGELQEVKIHVVELKSKLQNLNDSLSEKSRLLKALEDDKSELESQCFKLKTENDVLECHISSYKNKDQSSSDSNEIDRLKEQIRLMEEKFVESESNKALQIFAANNEMKLDLERTLELAEEERNFLRQKLLQFEDEKEDLDIRIKRLSSRKSIKNYRRLSSQSSLRTAKDTWS